MIPKQKPDGIESGNVIKRAVDELCDPQSFDPVYHRPTLEGAMPSLDALTEIVERLRMVIFPAYFSDSEMTLETMPYIVGNHLEKIERLLNEQIKRGFEFSCMVTDRKACIECNERAVILSRKFIATIPRIRRMLISDVMAAYEGDPAAKSLSEVIFCYPSIKAMTNFRIAHELYGLGVEIIPRIITEMAHSATGIDIHPGADIGERFFIDHGTGTVIGETCNIGRNVRLYQGVTLGAKSFPKDGEGRLVKGIPRHPIVEDDVIIYSGTTILGRVRIGKGSTIGGTLWLDHDVEPGTMVMQAPESNKAILCAKEGS